MKIRKKPLWLAVILFLVAVAGWVGNVANVLQLPGNLATIEQAVKPVMAELNPYLNAIQIAVIVGIIVLVVYGLDLHVLGYRLYHRIVAGNTAGILSPQIALADISRPVATSSDIAAEANALGVQIFALTATYQPQMPVTDPKYQALNAGIHADNIAAEKAVVAKYLTDLSGDVRRIGEKAKAQGLLSENDAWMISQRPSAVKAIEEFGAILFRIGARPSPLIGEDKQINMHQAYNLICELRRLDGATDPRADSRMKIFPEIRQLARDGKLVIRGCPIPKGMHDSRSPQENIPAEHWRHYDFEETVYMTDDDERNIRFASTSIDYANRLSIDRYNNLSVNERDIYRLFRSAS